MAYLGFNARGVERRSAFRDLDRRGVLAGDLMLLLALTFLELILAV